jgi:hypothetical protein
MIGFVVQNPTFRREPIFGPRLLDMNKRALARAI